MLNGWLAGGDIYRYVIEVPAWRHLNILDWAGYSRHADLTNGLFLFPIEAIGGFIPLLIISVMSFSNNYPSRKIIYLAGLFSLAGLILTFFAAPIMLSLRTAPDNPVLIQHIFDRFHFFGFWRMIMQVLAFCTGIIGIAIIRITTQDTNK